MHTREERMRIAVDLFKSGKTYVQIAQELDISIATVSNYISYLGLKPQRAKDLPYRIIKLHNEGLNTAQIAYELECSKSTVLDILRQNGYGRQRSKTMDDLINEDTQYAVDLNNRPLERIVEDGIKYIDITPLISPR